MGVARGIDGRHLDDGDSGPCEWRAFTLAHRADPGLYVGTISARVREELWSAVSASVGDGAAVLIHPADTEQGFALRTAGQRRRHVVDFDGLQLIKFVASATEPAPCSSETHSENVN